MPSPKSKSKPIQPTQPKPTSERITLKGEKKARVVYVGPRGGKYVKKDGQFVSLKSMPKPKSGKKPSKRMQKGGVNYRQIYKIVVPKENIMFKPELDSITIFILVESEDGVKPINHVILAAYGTINNTNYEITFIPTTTKETLHGLTGSGFDFDINLKRELFETNYNCFLNNLKISDQNITSSFYPNEKYNKYIFITSTVNQSLLLPKIYVYKTDEESKLSAKQLN